MASTIVLTRLDDQAEEIVSRFAEETGLTPEESEGEWVFPIETAEDHGIEVVQTLTEIDPDWAQHVGVADPRSA